MSLNTTPARGRYFPKKRIVLFPFCAYPATELAVGNQMLSGTVRLFFLSITSGQSFRQSAWIDASAEVIQESQLTAQSL